MSTFSINSQRKTHRITIPIQAIFEGRIYAVQDWSTQGFSLKTDDLSCTGNHDPQHPYSIALILPSGKASITLHGEARIKSCRIGVYGFEIVQMEEKNRRVLRHYATLAIEGGIEAIDMITGNLFLTNVQSPLKEPIAFTDKEYTEVNRSFRRRLLRTSILAFLFVAFVGVTLLYNLLLEHHTTATVYGNASLYTAPHEGQIKQVHVHTGALVPQGTLLFSMDSAQEQARLHQLTLQHELLLQQHQETQTQISLLQQSALQQASRIERLQKVEQAQYVKMLPLQEEAYVRAKKLLSVQMITLEQFAHIENDYLAFKQNYDDLMVHQNSNSKIQILAEQTIQKSEDLLLSLQQTALKSAQELHDIEQERYVLNQKIATSEIRAHHAGIVHSILHKPDEYLHYAQKVMTLQTDEQPYLLANLEIEHAANISVGTPCLLYSSRTGRKYAGRITGVGYALADERNNSPTELKAFDTPIRVEFETPVTDLLFNERLDLYILSQNTLAKAAQKLIPWAL